MGLSQKDLVLLADLHGRGSIRRGRVVEIGAQQLAEDALADRDLLSRLGTMFGGAGPCPLPLPPSVAAARGEGGVVPLSAVAPRTEALWKWLGFDYAAIDIDGSPGTVPLDLNYDSIPQEMAGRFDLVTNFGTTEHVANQLNAFNIIHDLTAIGGIMVHVLPIQGFFNHGLFNYNPKFFWMLARSNGYRWIFADIDTSGPPDSLPGDVIDFIRSFAPDFPGRSADYRAVYCGITVVLEKVYDTPYVAALDVATGVPAPNAAVAERYWTVFRPDAFDGPANARPGKREQT